MSSASPIESPRVKPNLALSTCWNSYRHHDGYVMLKEIRELGFTHAELSHGIRIVLVPGILRAVEQGLMTISSTHNFCPLPTGVTQAAPNLFQPTSVDAKEHDQWLRHTKRTLDFSAQVGARAMVMHLGSVPFLWFHPARRLYSYLSSHPDAKVREDERYVALVKKACAKQRKRMGPSWFQLKQSLEEIREYALAKGVAIGCENREKFEELPMDDDFEELFTGLVQPNPYGYWHDTGHAALKERLGLLRQQEHLEKNAARAIGFHLHDVSEDGKDHQPVGDGGIDFKMVSSFWRPEHLLTLELSPRVEAKDVLRSKARVDNLIAQMPVTA